MRVLLLTQVVPNPPDAGPKIKTHYVLRTLAERHEVELITFARSDEEERQAQALAPWCRSVTTIRLTRSRARDALALARGWLRGRPFLVERDVHPAFARAVRARLASGEIDVVHADQLSMACYLDLARGSGARRVFDAHNAVWQLVRELAPQQPWLRRPLAAIEWRLLRRFEGRVSAASDLVFCVAEADRRALVAAAGREFHALTVPIGVEVRDRPLRAPEATGQRRLLSIATMHYPPNADAIRWFQHAIWPQLRGGLAAGVDIVGTRPPSDLVAWGADDPAVTVHGYVEDVEPLYERAAAVIVPLRSGSGVRVKILEALARGVPVVSTTIGAEGLDLRHGEHLLIADTPEGFAAAVAAVLADPAAAAARARVARELVLARYDWRACCRPVLDGYAMLETPRPASVAAPAPARHANVT